MQFKLRHISAAAAAMLLAACGGGGGGESVAAGTPYSGKAVDGYLSFAKVVCDSNDNGVADTGEPVTYTDVKGNFVFTAGCTHGLIAAGGSSIDTGLPFVGQMRAPAGATVITPLTTLVAAGMTQDEVNKALSLPQGTNLLTTDPAATTSGGALVNAELLKKTLVVQQVLQKTTELFTGLGAVTGSVATNAVYTQSAAAFATGMKTASLFDSGGAVSSGVVNTLVSAALDAVIKSSAVSADVKANFANAGGVAAIAAISAPALASQAQVIADADSKNPADITAKTKDRQSSTAITDNAIVAVASGDLNATNAKDQKVLQDMADRMKTAGDKPAQKTTIASLPVYFDETVLPVVLGFNGAEGSSIADGPTSGYGKALNILRSGGEIWAGAAITVKPIAFTASRKTITARVYSPKAGIPIKIKAEPDTGVATAEAAATTEVVVGWQTLTWVLADAKPDLAYSKLVFLPDLGTLAPKSGDSYFFDNIQLIDNAQEPAPPGLPQTFDSGTSPGVSGFGGGEGSSIKAAPDGGSGKALNVYRSGGKTYAGASLNLSAIPFASGHKTITARVYSPKAGVPINLKAEFASQQGTREASATTTVVQGWQTLTWVLSDADPSLAYTSLVFLPDIGNVSPSSGDSYYFDDITLTDDPVASASNYVYLDNNSIGFSANGTNAAALTYSMADFQSENGGINIKWPMSNAAALKLKLKVNGNFSFDSSQTLSAAVRIEEIGGGKGEIRAYTDKVTVGRSGDDITLSVPNLPQALIYGVSGDGQTKAVIDFASKVRGITNTLSTASGAVSTVMFGEVVNFAITGLSNQFNNMSSMRGKYKVTLVVNELPLRKADGSKFDNMQIEVPTSVNGGLAANPIVINGYGLVGYINLTN